MATLRTVGIWGRQGNTAEVNSLKEDYEEAERAYLRGNCFSFAVALANKLDTDIAVHFYDYGEVVKHCFVEVNGRYFDITGETEPDIEDDEGEYIIDLCPDVVKELTEDYVREGYAVPQDWEFAEKIVDEWIEFIPNDIIMEALKNVSTPERV